MSYNILDPKGDGRPMANCTGELKTIKFEQMKNIQIIRIGTLWSCLLWTFTATAQTDWPVLKKYDQDHIQRIAMPMGGIGTGTVYLNGRGGLQDWAVMNRPAKGFYPSKRRKRAPFFAINVQYADTSITKLMEGPLDNSVYEGTTGSNAPNHGLPRFAKAMFETSYPFGRSNLTDPDMPVDVSVTGFNPLVPGDVDNSSIPMAVLTYSVTNKTDRPISVSLCGNIKNFIGYDGLKGKSIDNKNEFREGETFKGIFFNSKGVNPKTEQWGTMALVYLGDGEVSYRTSWKEYRWGSATLDFWDDFGADGILENRPNIDEDDPMASLAAKSRLAPKETKEFRFLITWHFPNRQDWDDEAKNAIGNYYCTQYADAWDVIKKTVPSLNELESRTTRFVQAFVTSDFPTVLKEAALFNLANLRTQLAFRTKEGHLLGWEGLFEHSGAGSGSCTHVWNYEQTTAFLFGELAKTMRDVEFGYATDKAGLMSFRAYLPLKENANSFGKAAADGQMGSIMKMYREWQLSGDDAFLKKHWPMVKKALEFTWIPKGWDANKDGVMEGPQHNTMDVEYFGPNPQMGFWYLGALRASEEMAAYLGEKEFSRQCRNLYEQGAAWIDAHLFNGEYYEQQIIPPMNQENVAPSLMVGMGAQDLAQPGYQLGNGVLVDQLIGQLMSHFVGLGYLAEKSHIRKTLQSIMKYNFKETLKDHTNFMRSYALSDESVLLMAAYPKGRPKNPFPYFTEVMTGFEYTAAIGMLYENEIENGLKSIQNIRNRYDGKKRNPFDEAEYGSHYARAMIAWGGILAFSGFTFSAVEKSMAFNAKNGTFFWSNGYQYGTVIITGTENPKEKRVELTSLNGTLELNSLKLKGFGIKKFRNGKILEKEATASFTIRKK